MRRLPERLSSDRSPPVLPPRRLRPRLRPPSSGNRRFDDEEVGSVSGPASQGFVPLAPARAGGGFMLGSGGGGGEGNKSKKNIFVLVSPKKILPSTRSIPGTSCPACYMRPLLPRMCGPHTFCSLARGYTLSRMCVPTHILVIWAKTTHTFVLGRA